MRRQSTGQRLGVTLVVCVQRVSLCGNRLRASHCTFCALCLSGACSNKRPEVVIASHSSRNYHNVRLTRAQFVLYTITHVTHERIQNQHGARSHRSARPFSPHNINPVDHEVGVHPAFFVGSDYHTGGKNACLLVVSSAEISGMAATCSHRRCNKALQ